MLELSEEGHAVVEALLRGPVAWQTPQELARTIDRDLDETIDLVAAVDAAGWLAAWERESDVVITLSVAAAAALGVRLVEFGRQQVPRWARRGEPEPPSLKASGVFREDCAASLVSVVDPALSAEERLEREEERLAWFSIASVPSVRPSSEGLPVPTHLLGIGLSPWPGPGDGRNGSCPCCGSKG